MRTFTRATLLLSLLGLWATTSSLAQDASSAADELIARNMVAIGGLNEARAISSLIMQGDVTVPSMGMEMAITIYQKRPNKMRSEVNVPNMGQTIISGFDGETAWTINPMAGNRPMKLEGDQASQMVNQADLDPPFVDYEKKGHKIEYVGEEEVDGRRMEKLRVMRADSTETVFFIDSETALVNRVEMESINPMTNQPASVVTILSDYREVGGIRMPFSMETRVDGQVFQTVQLDDIRANSAIDDARFRMPEEGAVDTDNR